MKKKVTVLGNGLVGSVMALDLAEDEGYEVTVCDRDEAGLGRTKERSRGKVDTRSDVDFTSPDSITEAVRGLFLKTCPLPLMTRLSPHSLRIS